MFFFDYYKKTTINSKGSSLLASSRFHLSTLIPSITIGRFLPRVVQSYTISLAATYFNKLCFLPTKFNHSIISNEELHLPQFRRVRSVSLRPPRRLAEISYCLGGGCQSNNQLTVVIFLSRTFVHHENLSKPSLHTPRTC